MLQEIRDGGKCQKQHDTEGKRAAHQHIAFFHPACRAHRLHGRDPRSPLCRSTGRKKHGQHAKRRSHTGARQADAPDRHTGKPLRPGRFHQRRHQADRRGRGQKTRRNRRPAPAESLQAHITQDLPSGRAKAPEHAEKFRPLEHISVQAPGNHQNGGRHHKQRKKHRHSIDLGSIAVPGKLPASIGADLPHPLSLQIPVCHAEQRRHQKDRQRDAGPRHPAAPFVYPGVNGNQFQPVFHCSILLLHGYHKHIRLFLQTDERKLTISQCFSPGNARH